MIPTNNINTNQTSKMKAAEILKRGYFASMDYNPIVDVQINEDSTTNLEFKYLDGDEDEIYFESNYLEQIVNQCFHDDQALYFHLMGTDLWISSMPMIGEYFEIDPKTHKISGKQDKVQGTFFANFELYHDEESGESEYAKFEYDGCVIVDLWLITVDYWFKKAIDRA